MQKSFLVKLIGMATLFLFLIIATLSLTRAVSWVWFWIAVAFSAFIGYYLLPRLRKAR